MLKFGVSVSCGIDKTIDDFFGTGFVEFYGQLVALNILNHAVAEFLMKDPLPDCIVRDAGCRGHDLFGLALQIAGRRSTGAGFTHAPSGLAITKAKSTRPERLGQRPAPPPPTTAMGTLLGHITGTARHRDSKATDFQPMNANFGLFPILQPPVKKKLRKAAYGSRALTDLAAWLAA